MAKVGRPLKSNEDKDLTGNPGKRPYVKSRSIKSTKSIACPTDLRSDPVGRAYWTRLCKLMKETGVLSNYFKSEMEVVASSYVVFRKASKEVLKAKSFVVKSPQGHPCHNPVLSNYSTASKLFSKSIESLKESMMKADITDADQKSVLEVFMGEFDEGA